jgi:GNAT superfamily N-acetyltransferase
MPDSYQILEGDLNHLDQVMSLIQELADFEKEPLAVTNNASQLKEDWLNDRFAFLVVEHGEKVIGFALCYYRYSTWKGLCLFLEDLYIQSAYRSKGIGGKLFDELVELARRNQCKLLNWQVLDWNTRAIDFYENKHAEISKIWYNGTLVIS